MREVGQQPVEGLVGAVVGRQACEAVPAAPGA